MADSLDELAIEASGCVLCGLSAERTNVVFGRGDPNAGLMFIGEAPGAEEDASGLPFVGRSGRHLQQLISEEMKSTIEDGIYIANMVKCRPPSNRPPTPEEVQTCSPYLQQQIKFVRPKVIVTLGNSATKPLLQTETGITKMRGQVYDRGDYVIIPTFHPSAILRDINKEKYLRQDLALARQTLESE